MKITRSNKNIISSWWWTVDHLTLVAVGMIIAFGAIIVTAASPSVAERIGLESFYFVKRQLVFLLMALCSIFCFSLLSPTTIRRISILGFVFVVILLITVLLVGEETKGATRWLYIFGFSLQPSEFVKPFFIVVIAWLLSESKNMLSFKGVQISILLYMVLVCLLILQPDLGMTVVVSAVWAGQLFISGISITWVAIIMVFALFGLLCAYWFLPHVTLRIDSFLGNNGDVSYQVKKSLEAFNSGGFFGRGPGEGVVKQYLPDSHTDFIFAVAGEELGIIVCLAIMSLYAFIIFRGFRRILSETDLFLIYAVSGLLVQFGVQSMINMGVALNLLPTKGMTLPFISYGGSSMISISISIGMLLALTRKRYGNTAFTQKAIV